MAEGDHVISQTKKCKLISAARHRESELALVKEQSSVAHAPWMYHGTTESYFNKILNGRTIGLFVIDTDDDGIGAVINLNEPVGGGFCSAHLGYFTAATKMRKGLMTEGLALALDYAFVSLDFHRLEANIQPPNTASKALVAKLGFRLEGFSPAYLKIGGAWRDHERYALLAEEWISSPVRTRILFS